MHKKLRDSLNKVQDFVADPKLAKTTEVVRGVIRIASEIGQAKIGGPIAVAGAVIGTLNVIQETFEIEKVDVNKKWLVEMIKKRPTFKPRQQTLPQTLQECGAFRFLPLEVFSKATRGSESLRGFVHTDGKMVVFTFRGEGDEATAQTGFYMDDDFDMNVFSEAMWKALDAPIVKLTGAEKSFPTMEGLQYDTVPYIGSHSTKEFADGIEVFRSRGMSRAYLLEGPPGTGKSSFARAYARDTNQTLLVVPPDFLAGSHRNATERLVRILKPDILLMDDIDRANRGLAYAMSMIDDLRRILPHMVVITTVNEIAETNAALLRPGRLGKRLLFRSPSQEEKVDLLRLYMGLYGVDASKFDLDALVAGMTHDNFSHDYVRFVAEESVALPQDELLASIEGMKELLAISEYMEPTLDVRAISGEASQPQPLAAPGVDAD